MNLLRTWEGTVLPQWIDRNRHLNVGYYMVVFDEATTRFFDLCGLDDKHRQRHGIATFSAESHATYERELLEGAPLYITTQLLGWSEKKVHYFHRLFHAEEGYLAATNELLSLHVSSTERRTCAFAPAILERFQELHDSIRDVPWPTRVGRVISLSARPPA